MFSCSSRFTAEENRSNCSYLAPNFLRMDPEGVGEDRLLRGQENVLMGGKEIEGNILEGGELRRRMGVLLVNL